MDKGKGLGFKILLKFFVLILCWNLYNLLGIREITLVKNVYFYKQVKNVQMVHCDLYHNVSNIIHRHGYAMSSLKGSRYRVLQV